MAEGLHTRCVRHARLKVGALVGLGHQVRLGVLTSIYHLPREKPSRLRNLLRYLAALFWLANVEFSPRVKFFDFRNRTSSARRSSSPNENPMAQHPVAFIRNPC